MSATQPLRPLPVAFETYVPVVSNRYLWADCLKVLGLALLAAGVVILSVTSYDQDYAGAPAVLRTLGIAGGGVLGAIALALLVVFPKGYRRCFRIDETGVLWGGRDGGDETAPEAGLLAASPQVAGSPMLARSASAKSIAWPQIRGIHFHRSTGVVCILNSWRVVVRLYCPPYAYAAVEDSACRYASGYKEPGIRIRKL